MPQLKLFQTQEEKTKLVELFEERYKNDLNAQWDDTTWYKMEANYGGNKAARVAEKLIALSLLKTLATHPDYSDFHILPIIRGESLSQSLRQSTSKSGQVLISHTIPQAEHVISPTELAVTNEISGFEAVIIIDVKHDAFCLFDFGFGGCVLKHNPTNFVMQYKDDTSFYTHDSLLLTQKVLKDTNSAIIKSLAEKRIKTDRIVSVTDIKEEQIPLVTLDDETSSMATMSINEAVKSLTEAPTQEATQYKDPMPVIKFLGLNQAEVTVHSTMDNGLLKLGILPLFNLSAINAITFGLSKGVRDTLIPLLNAELSATRLKSYVRIAQGTYTAADIQAITQKPVGTVIPPLYSQQPPVLQTSIMALPTPQMYGAFKKPQQLMPFPHPAPAHLYPQAQQSPYPQLIPFSPHVPASSLTPATPAFFQVTPQKSQTDLPTHPPLRESVGTIEAAKQHPTNTESTFDIESDLGFMSLRQPTQTFWQKTAEKRKALGTQSLGGANLGGSMLPELETPEARKARLEKKSNPQASSSNTPGM